MTPELERAVRLLRLSRLELIEEIRKELDAETRRREPRNE
jgi:DNA-directed RNA polymerase specialized sigma54-like protein